jgi:DNA-binding winged helix-turn-helix (wHTH) protein
MLPADATTAEPQVWRFDEFVLDLPRFELRRNDVAIPMEPQVFDVLIQLVSHHQRVVTKNELFDSVWGGRFVGEAALTSRIKAVRRALGDDGDTQRYIRTVRGRGYQFVGVLVTEAEQPPTSPACTMAPGAGHLVFCGSAARPGMRIAARWSTRRRRQQERRHRNGPPR